MGDKRSRRPDPVFESGLLTYSDLYRVKFRRPAAAQAPGGATRAAWDATIWQRDPDGTWRIAVDISTPLPPLRS
jgi:hypothetical protein